MWHENKSTNNALYTNKNIVLQFHIMLLCSNVVEEINFAICLPRKDTVKVTSKVE